MAKRKPSANKKLIDLIRKAVDEPFLNDAGRLALIRKLLAKEQQQ